jgi:DHA1 family inner membrane transport protein
MMGVAAIGFAGFFAVYSYIAEVVRREAGLPASYVPWVLAAIGVGMTLGNVLGGWAADRNLRRAMIVGFPFYLAAMAGLALTAQWPVALFGCAFAVGLTQMFLIPAVQTRLIAVSQDAKMLGAALVHSGLNIGNSLGAALGGVVIAAGFGYRAPSWVGVILGAVGLVLALVSFGYDRRTARAAVVAPAPERTPVSASS